MIRTSLIDVVILIRSGTWTRYWEPVANVPYLSNASSFISYDDSLSIALKCQYAIAHGLGGVMIWELSQDVVGQTQPLMEAVGLAMYGMSDVVAPRDEGIVCGIALFPNYPNPFNSTTVVSYQLPVASDVELVMYDLLGREVATLVDEAQEPGYKSVEWDASGVASGVYLYRLQAGDFVQTRKLVLLK